MAEEQPSAHVEAATEASETGAEVVVALTTCANTDDANRLVHTLLEQRLIACANLVDGVQSIYRWGGAVCRDAEVLIVMKTTTYRVDALKTAVSSVHTYDTPELLVLPVAQGLTAYMDWVGAEVSSVSSKVAS